MQKNGDEGANREGGGLLLDRVALDANHQIKKLRIPGERKEEKNAPVSLIWDFFLNNTLKGQKED